MKFGQITLYFHLWNIHINSVDDGIFQRLKRYVNAGLCTPFFPGLELMESGKMSSTSVLTYLNRGRWEKAK